MLTRTGSFKALLDDGQASAELSALRDKVATLSEVSSAQAAFFRESRSSQQGAVLTRTSRSLRTARTGPA